MPGTQASIRILRMHHVNAEFEIQPYAPPLNVVELEDRFLLVAELAGIDPDLVQIEVHPSFVVIYGVRPAVLPPGPRRLHRMEIITGPFQAFAALDRLVNPDQASAEYSDGLLEVTLPFAGRTGQEMVKIPIRSGSRP